MDEILYSHSSSFVAQNNLINDNLTEPFQMGMLDSHSFWGQSKQENLSINYQLNAEETITQWSNISPENLTFSTQEDLFSLSSARLDSNNFASLTTYNTTEYDRLIAQAQLEAKDSLVNFKEMKLKKYH